MTPGEAGPAVPVPPPGRERQSTRRREAGLESSGGRSRPKIETGNLSSIANSIHRIAQGRQCLLAKGSAIKPGGFAPPKAENSVSLRKNTFFRRRSCKNKQKYSSPFLQKHAISASLIVRSSSKAPPCGRAIVTGVDSGCACTPPDQVVWWPRRWQWRLRQRRRPRIPATGDPWLSE